VRKYEQDAGFGEPPSSNASINDFRTSDGLSNISRVIPFHLLDRNLVVGRVIKFCDPGRFLGGGLLGMLEAPTDLEVDSNTGRMPGVAVDQRQNPAFRAHLPIVAQALCRFSARSDSASLTC
jgi:hypothetical protein